jgi:hypothetical protein
MRLVIREFGHEARTGVSNTDRELVLAAGAGHRLLDIALRIGLPVRENVMARDFLNGLADRLPTSPAYKLKRWFPRRHALALSIDARVVGAGERHLNPCYASSL